MIALGRVASRWRADKEVAPEEGFEPPTQRLTAACSTTELLRNAPGGADRIRTGVHGFAGRCVTTPPPRRYPAEPDPAQPRTTRGVATIVSTPGRVNGGRHRVLPQFEFAAPLERKRLGWHTEGMSKPKRPRDPNQLAKLVVDIAVGDVEDPAQTDTVVEHAKRGGLKGGPARAANMTPEQRSEQARRAAAARWSRK